jgi:predicted nucleic acid-binding protein
MAYLIDTSVLVRLSNTADAHYATADRAVVELHQRGEVLYITAGWHSTPLTLLHG